MRRLEELAEFDKICITGGEPMLVFELTKLRLEQLRRHFPGKKIYLYTALYAREMEDILPLVNGVQFSLHQQATSEDVVDLMMMQDMLRRWRSSIHQKTHRLFIDSRVNRMVLIEPRVWSRVEVKPWLSEKELLKCNKVNNGLPRGETLFVLEKEAT